MTGVCDKLVWCEKCGGRQARPVVTKRAKHAVRASNTHCALARYTCTWTEAMITSTRAMNNSVIAAARFISRPTISILVPPIDEQRRA